MELVKVIKQSQIIKYVFFALIGTVLLAISSKIKIPFYPVPMTMQTFVVLFLGIALGAKIGLSQPIKLPNQNIPKRYIKEVANIILKKFLTRLLS